MKKIILWCVLIIIVLGLGIFFASGYFTGKSTEDGVQKITLSMKNYNYYPNTITVKEGKEVEITLDQTVGGCYRDFNIPKFGVSKYSSSPEDTIKFTPTSKGTFQFRCEMGMGTGTIIVE